MISKLHVSSSHCRISAVVLKVFKSLLVSLVELHWPFLELKGTLSSSVRQLIKVGTHSFAVAKIRKMNPRLKYDWIYPLITLLYLWLLLRLDSNPASAYSHILHPQLFPSVSTSTGMTIINRKQ